MVDATWLLVGLPVVVLTVLVVAAGILLACWWLLVWPVVEEVRRARAAEDPWTPFVPREDGSWGPLVDNRWWAALRRGRSHGGPALAVRWGFWLLMAILLTFATGCGLWGLVRLGLLGLGRG